MSNKPPVARVVGPPLRPVLIIDSSRVETDPDGTLRVALTWSDLAWLARSVNERMARIVMPMG